MVEEWAIPFGDCDVIQMFQQTFVFPFVIIDFFTPEYIHTVFGMLEYIV